MQYVLSDTRCPALHDCQLKCEEAGQWPQSGQSPVEYRGTFASLSFRSSPRALSGLKSTILGMKSALAGLESALSDPKYAINMPSQA